jgi:hypothetical protein
MSEAVAYIVVISNPPKAVDLIRENPPDEIQDLGRVSAALLIALELLPGEFIRADGQR